MPTVFYETNHAAAHLVSEANGYQSREKITIGTGANLPAGQILGKITASGKYVALNPAASDGSQTAAGALYAPADAASADVQGVAHVRNCELHGGEIVWPAGITTPQKTAAIAQLLAAGIILR